jgi:hypothetical protein
VLQVVAQNCCSLLGDGHWSTRSLGLQFTELASAIVGLFARTDHQSIKIVIAQIILVPASLWIVAVADWL